MSMTATQTVTAFSIEDALTKARPFAMSTYDIDDDTGELREVWSVERTVTRVGENKFKIIDQYVELLDGTEP